MISFTVDSILGKKESENIRQEKEKKRSTPFVHLPRRFTTVNNKCSNVVAISKYGTAIIDDSYFGQVAVSLDNFLLWNMFRKVGTEMVITKSGRRMFPALRFSVSGLNPSKCYSISVEIFSADDYRYKYHDSEWCITGKAYPEVQRKYRMCVHNDSPAPGSKWNSNIVSFHKLKITNNNTKNTTKQIILNSLQKYQPRLHISEIPDDVAGNSVNNDQLTNLENKPTMTFEFPETTFVAVTAYQSEQITQLKIDNNPFAKGFRDPTPAEIERTRLLNPSLYNMLIVNTNEMNNYHLSQPPQLTPPPTTPYHWKSRETPYHPYLPRRLLPPTNHQKPLDQNINHLRVLPHGHPPKTQVKGGNPWYLTDRKMNKMPQMCACCQPQNRFQYPTQTLKWLGKQRWVPS